MRRLTFAEWSKLDLAQVPHGRRILASITIDSAGSGLLLAFIPLYFSTRAHLDATELGGLMTAGALIALPAGTAVSPLVSRLGASRTIQWINVGRFAAGLIALFAHGPFTVVVALAGMAWGENGFWSANGTFVSDVAGAQRQRWYAVERSIRNASAGLGAVVGGAAVAVSPSNSLFSLMALNAASFLVAGLLLRPVQTSSRPSLRAAKSSSAPWRARCAPYLDWRLLGVLAVTVCLVVPLLAFAPLLMLSFASAATWGSAATGGLIALNVCILVAVQPWFTAHMEIVTKRTLMVMASAAVAASGAVLALGMLLMGPWLLPCGVGALLLITYCELAINSSLYEMVARIAPEDKLPAYMAAYQLAWASSSVVWPVATLPLISAGQCAIWMGLAGFGLAGAAISFLLPGAREVRCDDKDAAERVVDASADAPGASAVEVGS